MTEEGYDIIESPLPCLITVVKEINELGSRH
jgi:electron transfer flavoprotein alpha/beta subunit